MKLVLVKQAFFIDISMQKIINALSKEEIIKNLINYKNEKNYSNKTDLFWMYTNAILNKNLDEIVATNKNISLVDPTKNLYEKNKLDFFQEDGLHLNFQGNRVIANKIFESLVSNELFEK